MVDDTMHISSITKNDTEETIMNKVKAALNGATVFDVYEGNNTSGRPSPSTHYVYGLYENNYMIDVPVYETRHDRAIQSGANKDQAIHLIYKSLRLMNLGIHDSNVLTEEAASKAITDVQSALDIVSEQRIHRRLRAVSGMQIWRLKWWYSARKASCNRRPVQC